MRRAVLLLCFVSFPALAGRAADSELAALSATDPVLRETAIRHVISSRGENQSAVASAFISGELATRVNALEVLNAWGAPVEGLDPWDPATLTPARLDALKHWAATPPPTTATATQPATLSAVQQSEAAIELRELVSTSSEPDRLAIQERLARLGPALLPEINRALADKSLADASIRRLTALKYRLFTDDALLARWHDGPARITSTDRATREAAVNELVEVATDADAPLLLQLFTDPDPLVRELSLRTLKTLNGENAAAALGELLKDPEPNVRAAVLKELAESPSAGAVPAVVAYIHREKDDDLLGHAIRVLRAINTEQSVNCLIALLQDPSWRVRAEAAEALVDLRSKSADDDNASSTNEARVAKITAALAKCLEDSDGYVVSRAMMAFQKVAPPKEAIDTLMRVAEKHPEITSEVVKALTNDSATVALAYPQLKTFASHPDPAIRVQVIGNIGGSLGLKARVVILHALSDPDEGVRIAAADVYRDALWKILPENGKITQSGLFGSSEVAIDPHTWLVEFKSGKRRPRWLDEAKPPLLKMLDTGKRSEQIATAAIGLALNDTVPADKLLASINGADVGNAERLSECLPWLSADARKALVKTLLDVSETSWERQQVFASLARIPDDNFLPTLWDFVSTDTELQNMDDSMRALNGYYFGQTWYINNGAENPSANPAVRRAIADLVPHARTGNEPQRLLAVAVLSNLSGPDATAVARDLLKDPATSAGNKRDAFQVVLLFSKNSDALPLAMQSLRDPALQTPAIYFLGGGRDALRQMRGSISIYGQPTMEVNGEDAVDVSSPTPHKILPPAGLTADMVRPFLGSRDSNSRIFAAYLLCLFKDRDALKTLKAAVNAEGTDSSNSRLLYRAIVAFNDDSLTPELEKIYTDIKGQTSRVRDFYWTIGSIDGPDILKLRKKIRDEVGVDQLR